MGSGGGGGGRWKGRPEEAGGGTGVGKAWPSSPGSLEHSDFLPALVFRPSLVLWRLVIVIGGAGFGALLEFESRLCFLDQSLHFLSLNGANCITGLGRINEGSRGALSAVAESPGRGVPPKCFLLCNPSRGMKKAVYKSTCMGRATTSKTSPQSILLCNLCN